MAAIENASRGPADVAIIPELSLGSMAWHWSHSANRCPRPLSLYLRATTFSSLTRSVGSNTSFWLAAGIQSPTARSDMPC